jgi:hypothetical protein
MSNDKRDASGKFAPLGAKRMTSQERWARHAPQQLEWQRRNPEKRREYEKRYLSKPGNLEKKSAWRREYYKRNSDAEKIRKAARERPQFCESCGDAPDVTSHQPKLCFDHDHDTGRFRGWLCFRCNTALGFLLDDPRRIAALAAYLNKWRETR